KETIEFYNTMLLDYQEVTRSPENPRDITYDACIKALKENHYAMTFDELIKEVCEKNDHIARYLGFGHKSLQTAFNRKVRNVRDLLIKNPNIKRTNERPIVLEWFESDLVDSIDLLD